MTPELVVSRAFGALRVSSGLGYLVREDTQLIDPVVEDELFVRLGLGYRLSENGGPPLELDASLSGATCAAPPFDFHNQNHAELRAGASYRVAGPVVAVLAGGLGVREGFGTPAETANAYQDTDGCPDQKPDRDGDGLTDDEDQCPDVAEDVDSFEDTDGCAEDDNDKDSVRDSADRCPNEPGPTANRGCPDTDRDGDTVVDRLDNCPDQAGSPAKQGCVDAQAVHLTDGRLDLLDNVYFASNQARILPRSFPLLRNVARVLVAQTGIHRVRVEGHTDDRGDPALVCARA